MVAAALRSVFAQQGCTAVEEQWDQVAAMLTAKVPRAAELMASAREDVLAFRHLPVVHWRKLWSTNLLERFNQEIKRRTRVVGIFPNAAAITLLVGAVLLEQDEHWQLEGRRITIRHPWITPWANDLTGHWRQFSVEIRGDSSPLE
jgi:putative transposase